MFIGSCGDSHRIQIDRKVLRGSDVYSYAQPEETLILTKRERVACQFMEHPSYELYNKLGENRKQRWQVASISSMHRNIANFPT